MAKRNFKEIEKAFDRLATTFLKLLVIDSRIDEDDIYYNGHGISTKDVETLSEIVKSAKECGFTVESAESRYLNGDIVYHAEIVDEENEWAFEIQFDENYRGCWYNKEEW